MAFRLQEPTIVGRFFDYPAGAASAPNKSACWYAAQVQASDFVARLGVRAKGALCAMFEGLMERICVPLINVSTQDPITGMKDRDVNGCGSAVGMMHSAESRESISELSPRGWMDCIRDFYNSVFASFFWNGTHAVPTETGTITVGPWMTDLVPLAHYQSEPCEFQSRYNTQAMTCSSLEWYMDGKMSPWHGDDRPGDQESMFDQWIEGSLSECGAENVIGSYNERSFEQYATDLVVDAAHVSGNNYWTTDSESLANGLTWVSPRRSTVAYAVAQSMLAAMRCTMFRFGYVAKFIMRKQVKEDIWLFSYDSESGSFTAVKQQDGDVQTVDLETADMFAFRSLSTIGYAATPQFTFKLPEDVYATSATYEHTVAPGLGIYSYAETIGGSAGSVTIRAECARPYSHGNSSSPLYPIKEIFDDGYLDAQIANYPEKFVDRMYNYGLDGKARRQPNGTTVWVDSVSINTNRLRDATATHLDNTIAEMGLNFVSLPTCPEFVAGKITALSNSILGGIRLRYVPGLNEVSQGVCMPAFVEIQGNTCAVSHNDGEWVCDVGVVFNWEEDQDFCLNGAPAFMESFSCQGSPVNNEHTCIGATRWNWKAVPVNGV